MKRRTSIGRHFVYPLILDLSVLAIPSPGVDPFLPLLVPHLLLLPTLLDALRSRKGLPFCGCLRLGKRLRARELGNGRGKLGDRTVGRGLGGEGEERLNQDLNTITGKGLEVLFEVLTVDIVREMNLCQDKERTCMPPRRSDSSP